MSLSILHKFIDCLKEQNPDLDDLDILIALRGMRLKPSEIYCISPQLATRYKRLMEIELRNSTEVQNNQPEQSIETERPKDWHWLSYKPSSDSGVSIEPEGSEN